MRAGDIVGRPGGEEFSVLLPSAGRAEAAALGEPLCRAVAVHAAVDAEGAKEAPRGTLSGGAALGEVGLPLDRLMARADAALHQAKAAGRARLVVRPGGEVVSSLPKRASQAA